MRNDRRMSVSLSDEVVAQLDKLRDEFKCSRSEILRKLVEISLAQGYVRAAERVRSIKTTYRGEYDQQITEKIRSEQIERMSTKDIEPLIGEQENLEETRRILKR